MRSLHSGGMTSPTTPPVVPPSQTVDLTTPVLAAIRNARGVIDQACSDLGAADAARADAAARLRAGVQAADQAVGFALGGGLADPLTHRTRLAAAVGCTARQLDRAFSDPTHTGHCGRVLAAIDALTAAMTADGDGKS